ncbi:hypothetical protein SCHPADRAFT_592340 [Schizopora paradoxa]|uniref:MYND-type domain-containing protein n=1 Tax=Schizopora paradoxa TaxID=27342 RepID=A0A0H2RAL3_9AGAM|nr:hypothetical protein SCHPADRAFT_592340 [Schizopora paradoxa]
METRSRSEAFEQPARTSISSPEAVKLIRAAKVELKSLIQLVNGLGSGSVALATSDKLRTDCFDVFHYHLRKPVERHKCLEFAWIRLITSSLYGVALLGCEYFDMDAVHRQRYKLCWPSILKWLEAIIEGEYYQNDEDHYFNLVPILFRTLWTVRRELFDEDDLFRFAIRLWIGHRADDKTDYYAAQPLIACMQRRVATNDTTRAEEILQANGFSAERLIDKIVARLKHPTYGSSIRNFLNVTLLVDMLGHLIALTERTLLAVASSKVGRILIPIMTEFVNGVGVSVNQMLVVRSTLSMFHTFLIGRPVGYAVALMEAGILNLLLKAASLGFDDALEYKSSSWTARAANSVSEPMVLWELVLCLPYREIAAASRVALHDLYTCGIKVDKLLGASSDKFRGYWKTFETVVLEQTVLLSLFEVDYATDNGACSNLSCRRLTLRKELQKCAGCAVALYCSTSCQKEDWQLHREICKKINESSRM